MPYIVLKPISPQEGPIIEPAPPARPGEPENPPVLVDDALFSGETADERAASIARLIELGVIAPVPEPEPEPQPEPPAIPRRARTQE
jgi:hypothetical protein